MSIATKCTCGYSITGICTSSVNECKNLRNPMSNKLTVKEALEQGYMYFAKDQDEFQHLHRIEVITEADFEDGPQMLAEKEPYHTPGISSETIADLLADNIASWNGDETGDDTDDVYDTVKALDFTTTANLINEALSSKKYYKLTNIQLIPNPVTNEQ